MARPKTYTITVWQKFDGNWQADIDDGIGHHAMGPDPKSALLAVAKYWESIPDESERKDST